MADMRGRGLGALFLFVGGRIGYLVICISLLMPVALCYGADVSSGSSLNEDVLELVNSAVFEVVVRKPARDSLTYEKALPFDLLPYAIRTDKYYSIGTAFAVGPEEFVSAAHVMNLDHYESQFGEVYLRDGQGEVYEIDRIAKYSDHRDFVMFSLKNKTAKDFFRVNKSPKMNERVYAVGNALGQGIIIRDGLYTSNTPEEIDGKWQWIRFSAAASPGNSGGPLLDKEGKVIGIVLGKSENENLNYALPMYETLNAKPVAVSYMKVKYMLENMDMTKHATISEEFDLPKTFGALKRELVDNFNVTTGRLLEEFLAENRENIFPNGSGSSILLHNTYSAVFPHLIEKGKDGNWDVFYPSETKSAELGNNGYFTYGGLEDTLFMYIQKPDDVPLKTFYKDSKLFMDLIMKGLYFSRKVSSEKIKIISLGKAHEEFSFTDSYGRKWMVKSWLIEYNDQMILAFSLPVPGGCVTLIKSGQTGRVKSGYLPDLKVLADFVYVSYYGTYAQWQEFLKLKKLLPDVFSEIEISFGDGMALRYKSKRLSFTQSPGVMEISAQSDLNLLFGYFNDGTKTVWDVKGIVVGENKNNETSFGIYREGRPPQELRDSYQSEWENIVNRKFPYNASAYYRDGKTVISTTNMNNIGADDAGTSAFLYSVTYQAEGTVEQGDMEQRLEKINASLDVLEAGSVSDNKYTMETVHWFVQPRFPGNIVPN